MPAQAGPARSLAKPLLALLLLALAIATTGYFYLGHQLAAARRAAHQELAAIADLKVSQISTWLAERKDDTQALFHNPIMQEHARRFLAGRPEPQDQEHLLALMESQQRIYGYDQVALYDAQGRPRLGAPWPPPMSDQEGLAQALASPEVTFTDLHLAELPGPDGGKAPRLAWWAPILGVNGQALGAVQLLVDPRRAFFSLVNAWPTPSPSAVVILVRREGDEIVFLNPLRRMPEPALRQRWPLQPETMPSVMAVLSREVPVDGTLDHRGVMVLATWRPVPGTPWLLVTKVDRDEVHADQGRLAWTTSLVMVLLLLAAAAGLGLAWRQRDNQWLRRQLAMDQERRELAQRVVQLNQQANDIVLLMDQDWRILEANQKALDIYGYPQAQLLGMNGRDLRAPAARADFDRQTASAALRAGTVYETLHQRADGSLFPVEVSIREVEVGGRKYRQSFIRDISERQQAGLTLAKSEAELKAIFQGAPIMMILVDQERRVVKANQAALEFSGRGEGQALGLSVSQMLNCRHALDDPRGCGYSQACQSCPLRAAAQQTRSTGLPVRRQRGTFLMMRPEGPVEYYLLVSTALLQNHDKQWVLVCLEDVTDQHRVEDALRGSEEKFAKAFQHAPLLITLSALEDGTYLEVNDKFLEVSGFARDEVLGRTSIELGWLKAPDRQRILDEFQRAGRVGGMELELRAKDGRAVTCLFHGELVTIGGRQRLLTIAEDISQRKQAEEALLASQREGALLATLLENSSQPFTVGFPDGSIGRHNQAFLDLVGYGHGELTGLRWSQDLTPPRWRQREAECLAELARSGRPVRYEKEYLRKDGTLVPVELLVNMTGGPDGQPEYFYAFVTDISQRKQAEAERQNHVLFLENLAMIDQAIKSETDVEQMLWRVTQTVFDLFQCDRAWLFHPADPQAQTFQVPVEISRPEYPGAGLLGQDLPMPPDMAEDLAYILKSEEPTAFGPDQEKPVNRLTAEHFAVQSQMVVPVYPKVGPPWAFGMHQCSHPRQWTAAERRLFKEIGRRLADGLSSALFLRQLRQSEERFRAIFEQAAVGMVQAGPDGRLQRVNQRMADFLGQDPRALLGQTIGDITHPDDRPADQKNFALLLKGETSVYSRSKRYLKKDGSLVWGRVTASAVRDGQGRAQYIIGVVEDITEQRQLEAQLRQAQKMEAMGTLAGGIAHDFNNILGAVMGYAEMALEDASASQARTHDIEQVIKAALRAKNLIQQILTFSRKSESDLRPLNLNQLVAQTVAMLERTLPKMIAIQTRLSPELPPVNGDPNQLEQVLLNLATNAQDAMPQGGHLLIETKRVVLDRHYADQHPEVRPGAYALLLVTDSGQGMDPATRDKAFDPFFTTKEVGKGTGLGLSMVYGIVKAHRGQVTCYSQTGLGTTFKVYLPAYLEQPAQEALAPREGREVRGGSETILLVDDEEPLRQLGGRLLEGAGYQVHLAQSGEEALEVFLGLDKPPDLVVLDLGMPGMGGHRCLERLLALAPDLKVVIASGYAVAGQVQQALDSGALAYVSKPFRQREILEQVRAVLDGAQGGGKSA